MVTCDLAEALRVKSTRRRDRQMVELTVLNAVAKAGVEATSVESLIEIAAQAITQQLYPGADFGVGLIDKTANVLQSYRFMQGRQEELQLPLGQGIIGRVIASGMLVNIGDLSTEPEYIAISQPARSELCVPLKGRDQIIGVLNLESSHPNAFNGADEQLMMTFAGQLVVAIEKNRLYLRAVSLAERRAVLYRVAQEISASLDMEQVFSAIHRAAKQLMPSDDFLIALVDKARAEIETVYVIENQRRLDTFRFSSDQGLSGYVISTGRSLKIDDFDNENIQIPSVPYGTNQTRSYLFVPLLVKGQPIGVLSVQSYSPYVYSRDDQEMLEMLASQAAIAIDNARLFAEVQELATIDPLTGIYNRRHFFRLAQYEIDRARRYSHPLSAIMIDIDNFKLINDTYGHATGDKVLRGVTSRCRSQLRDTDFFCRYGGEEFTILLPDTDLERARIVAERLRQEVEMFRLDSQEIPLGITISIGISAFSSKNHDLEALIQAADLALYAAKSTGRNQIRVDVDG